MLSPTQIEHIAKKAAAFAARVLAMDYDYSIELINDPTIIEDGLFDPPTRTIKLNLAQLRPFSAENFVDRNDAPPEEGLTPEQSEQWGLILKICSVTFHEMRHMYQVMEARAYAINSMYGGRIAPQHESNQKCAKWVEELKDYTLDKSSGTDVEEDADDFAYYLSNRYPFVNELLETNRRIGSFKRKYDKVLLRTDMRGIPSGLGNLDKLVDGTDDSAL